MKVGDLVTYGSWYTKKKVVGLILEKRGRFDHFFLVAWNDGRHEWEGREEVEKINESRRHSSGGI